MAEQAAVAAASAVAAQRGQQYFDDSIPLAIQRRQSSHDLGRNDVIPVSSGCCCDAHPSCNAYLYRLLLLLLLSSVAAAVDTVVVDCLWSDVVVL
jgi:hypothetical protein